MIDAARRETVGSHFMSKSFAIQLHDGKSAYGELRSAGPGTNFHLTENLGWSRQEEADGRARV